MTLQTTNLITWGSTTVVVTCYGAYLVLVCLILRICLMVNIAQFFLILRFSINSILPLVTLSFTRLILLYFSVCCYY